MTSEEERLTERLRRARVTEPMPPEVTARLDEALTDAAGAEQEPRGAHVSRVDRHRRQMAAGLVAAAVAAVAIGVGLAQLLGGNTSATPVTAGDGGSSDSRAHSAGSERPDTAADPRRTARGDGADEDAPSPGALRQRAEVPRTYLLQPGRFRADVRRLRREVLAVGLDTVPAERPPASPSGSPRPGGRRTPGTASGADGAVPPAWARCGPDPGPADVQVGVRYGGRPGVVLLRPPRGQQQRVDLYLCRRGSATPAPESAAGRQQPERERTVRLRAP